jgi:hypothetical protein
VPERIDPGVAAARGALTGFVPGAFVGALLGAGASWAAGAAVNWLQQLSFTTGIQVQLLPFGDQVGFLQTVQDGWFYVIPAAALAVGLVAALVGALTGLVLAASYALIRPGPR